MKYLSLKISQFFRLINGFFLHLKKKFADIAFSCQARQSLIQPLFFLLLISLNFL